MEPGVAEVLTLVMEYPEEWVFRVCILAVAVLGLVAAWPAAKMIFGRK